MFAALGSGGLLAGFFHLTTHAAFKAMLFLAAGNVIHAVHSNELADMGGLARKMRWTTGAWIVGTLALVGIPGLSGFFSKDMVLEVVSQRGFVLPLALLVITTGLTAFYMGRVAVLAFFGQPAPRAASAHEPGASMLLPVLLLAVPSIALGWVAGPIARSIGAEHHFHLGAVSIVALVVALVGLALAWLVHGSKSISSASLAFLAPAGRLARGSFVDGLHLAVYRSVMLRIGAAAGWVDRYVVDAVMNVVGVSVIAGGRRLRTTQTGDVTDYVWMVLAATALVAAWGALR
jgi:NADH-quinone oxidoreductase subunit L